MPEDRRTLKARAGDAALGMIKYVVVLAVAIGSAVAVFYTSQAAQD